MIILLIRGFITLIQNGPYDVCHMHAVNRFRCVLAKLMLITKSYKKLILSFWGSDLLTASAKQLKKMESSLDAATTVTLSTEEMRKVFSSHFGSQYDNKIVTTSFPTTVVTHISNYLKNDSVNEIKETFGFPKDKIIVVCGYNGSTRQQHIHQLNQLKTLEKNIKDSLYIVVPMTYGGTAEYIALVENAIKDSGIQGEVLTEYLSELEIAKLWTAIDVFIHTQPTDGFSSSMRENLYAGNVVINGSWLKYKELDDANAFILKLDSFEQLQNLMCEVVSNLEYYKIESMRNSNIMSNMFSIEKEYKKWSDLHIE